MLSLGESKPWPEALETLTGQRELDASALADYFAPLKTLARRPKQKEQLPRRLVIVAATFRWPSVLTRSTAIPACPEWSRRGCAPGLLFSAASARRPQRPLR